MRRFFAVSLLFLLLAGCEPGGGDGVAGVTGEPGVAASPLPWLPVLDPGVLSKLALRRETPGEAIGREVEAITQGANIVFDTPEAMEQGTTEYPTLLLSLKRSIQELIDDFIEEFNVESIITTGEIQVTNDIEAQLVSPSGGFTITEITPRRQHVEEGQNTWRWGITATAAGEHSLFLSINSLIETPVGVNNIHVRSFQKRINVTIRPVSWNKRVMNFVQENWQYILGTLAIPLIGFLYKKLFVNKKADG